EGGRVENLVTDVGKSSAVRQTAFLSLGLMGALLIAAPATQPLSINRWHLALLLVLGGWMVMSILWSQDPVHSLKQCAVPLLATIAALGIAKQWQPRQVCLFVAIITSLY